MNFEIPTETLIRRFELIRLQLLGKAIPSFHWIYAFIDL